MEKRKRPQDMTNEELQAKIVRTQKALNLAIAEKEGEKRISEVQELIDALQTMYDSRFIAQELAEIKELQRQEPEQHPKSQPFSSGTLSAKTVTKKDSTKEKVKTKRIKKDRYFEQTYDRKKFSKLVVRLQVKLLTWCKLSKKDSKRAEYERLVTEYTQDVIDFVKLKAKKELIEHILKEYNYSSCYEDKRFTLNIEKTLKDFKIKK